MKMKKENRILYRIGALLLTCVALAVWAADTDTDGMSDEYEQFFGLNYTNATDALLDSDSDSLTNLTEALLWTDPFIPDTDQDGWPDNTDSNPLSRAVFMWGDTQFTSNSFYSYTGPAWWSYAFKMDGSWTSNGWEVLSGLSNNTGSLNIRVLRELLTNDAVLDVEMLDDTNSSLFVALCNTNQSVIVSNLFGNIVTGDQAVVTHRLSIPFSSYSNASIVRLWRGTGDITVYSSLMYIDNDGDGLDADQEIQAGTSDSDADSDDDGLNDFAELMLTVTDPLDADSDDNGYNDNTEVVAGSDPNDAQSLPVSAVSVFGTINYSGSATGTIHVVAVTDSEAWVSSVGTEIASPEAYTLTNSPVLTNIWLKAWRDTDGDGTYDLWEAKGEHVGNPLNLSLPVSNINVTLADAPDVFSVPFSETFEAVTNMAGIPGDLYGQHGWDVSGDGDATVQSDTVFSGSQALSLTDASVYHDFTDGQTNVWVSWYIQSVKGETPTNLPDDIAVVFYVNTEGCLSAYSNQTSVALPVPVPDGWNRFDIHADYTAQQWDMRFNREQVVSGFPFYGSPDAFSILRLDGKSSGTYMDDVQVAFANPDSDGDGYTDVEETQAGSDPDDAQDLPEVTVSGTVGYSGSQTGTIYAVAVTSSNDWNLAASDALAGAGAYSITNVPVQADVWVKAWLDVDADGVCDLWEAQGIYTSNPLYRIELNPVSDIDLTLTDPDVAAIELENSSVSIPEGSTNLFGVRLTAEPVNTSTVLVSIASGDTDVSVQSGASLVFTSGNWSNFQYAVLAAAQDGDWTDGTAAVHCVSVDQAPMDAVATEADDDFDPTYSMPWAETFEAGSNMADVPGDLDGQHGWAVSGSGSAVVQSNTVFDGSQAVAVTDASASHGFVDGRTNVWVSYRIKPVRGNAPGSIPTNIAVVFWVNSAGNLCVYSNQTPITLPSIVPEDWNRFEFHCDFTVKRWDLRLNRELVVSDFPFYGAPDAFSLLRLDGNGNESSYMDDVSIVIENPDRDSDGYTNEEEDGISDPDDANSIPVSIVSVSGSVAYSGGQTGSIHVLATTVSNDWNLAVSDTLAGAGTYSITNVPVQTNVWIKAWRDSNGNGSNDAWEAQSVYADNPLVPTWPLNNVNLTLADPDTDADSLPDWWELAQFGNLSSGSTNDPDSDGLSNADEMAYSTDPNDADSDDDNWTDGEEVALDSDPLDGNSLPVSETSVSGSVSYTGRQTGTLYVLASTVSNDWNLLYSDALEAPGAYSITHLPVLTNVWIKAWVDSNDDGSNGLYEASAVYGGNPLWLTRPASNLNLTLTEDSDADGLPDWWEVQYFTNLSQTATNDADGDTLSNLDEYGYETSPVSGDTDNDGLTDNWELDNGYNPLFFADCMNDEDGDGFGTVYEVYYGTSWTNEAEVPAVTTNVAPDQKIQDVIDASSDYAIIHIQPGTYSGWKNRDIHFDGKPVMLMASNVGDVILNVDGQEAFESYTQGEDIRTVIEGLVIRNAGHAAVYFANAGFTLRNCVIENCGSETTLGGGVYVRGALARIENCVFFQNTGTNGSAIYAKNADLELVNCTIVSNSITGVGGSLSFEGSDNTLTIQNTILWEDGTNPVDLVSGTADITYSCVKGGAAGTGNITNNPQVLANGYHLNLNSACIDAGTVTNAPETDIEGNVRSDDTNHVDVVSIIDIGAWEYNASYADSDSDGYTDAVENGVSDPEDDMSLPVNTVAVSGTVDYSGPQSGTIYVTAVTASNDWNLGINDALAEPAAYSITNVPVLTNIWIKTWRDSDSDGVCDAWEAQDVYEANPLYLRLPASSINLTLLDPDTDADNLPDWWEYAHFSGLSSGGADDPDGDGLVNSNELVWLTSPNNPDTDEDGLNDGWMVTNSFSPLQISYEQLAGCWRLDETNGTVAADSSGAGNDGAVTGAAHAPGWLRNGLAFDGTDDSVAVANSAAYKPEQFTLMLRVRFGSLYGNTVSGAADGTMTLLSQKGTGSAPAIELRKTETHALEFEVSDGTSGTVVRSSDNFFVTGHWYQVTAVYDGTNAALYADGIPVDSKAAVGPISYAADEGLMLGSSASGLPGGYLAGTLDDIAIFNRAFSAQEFGGLAFSVTDTDGDGLSNREEQQVGTNPNTADSDNDGLVDGEELRYGTNPEVADSDNDGLTDTAEIRTYYTNPNSSDSDSDGLSDYEEVITHGTNPNDADSDDDNLSDSTEIAAGTNPLNADSDGDGVEDGDEVTNGLNPLVAETDSDGDGLSNVDEVYFYGTSATNSDSNANGTNDLYTVNVLAGTNTVYRWTNNWVETDSALTAISNGLFRAEYVFNITEPDVYLIGVQASNAWPNALSNAEFNVQMLVDGIPVEMIKINAAPGTNGWGLARTPFLTATTHVVRLAWMAEVETNELISIEAVALQRIDGQIDANGRQDWVNTLLASGVDSDGDGLTDISELDSCGTALLNRDTDGDTLSDAEELNIFGLNPLLSDSDTNSIPDAVLLQTRNGSDTAERWGQWYDHSRDSTIATNEIKAIWDGVTAFYDFTVPTSGMYRVGIQVRNHWGDPKDNYSFRFLPSFDYQEAEPVEVYADTDRGNTVYFTTPWLTPGTHRIGFEWINDTWQTNRRLDMLLQQVRFYSVDGGTNDWMGDALTASGDSDGDGLSDYDEVHTYGTAPTVADTDGDGVNDGDEISAGTNPNNRDSDGDGVNDYTELNIAYSNPTNADYGAVTTNLVINGWPTVTNTGTWAQDGSSIYARERNGFLEYNLNIATNGNYVLKVYGHQRNALTSQRTFDLRLYVNGMYTGKQLLDGPYGSNSASVLFFLPNLEAGSHTVRLDWENISPNTFLQIDKLELLSLEGDWLASRLDNIAGVDAVPADSLISPVFIEGMGWYQEMLSMQSSYVPPENTNYVPVIEQGLRQNWYSDVLLSPTNSTAVDVLEENGQKAWSNTVQWTEFNLPDVQTNLMTIRKGDALLLNSHPSGISTGAVQLEIIGVTNYTTTAEAPVPHVFDVAGVFTVEGVYSDGSTNLMAVKVVGGSFAGEPICVIRRERTWDCNNLPPEAVIEHDDRLTLSETLLPDGGRRFTLRTDQEEPLTVLARLGAGGPVLSKTTVQPVNGDNGAYWKTVQSFPDGSRMVMVNLHMGNVPDDLLIKLTIVVGGVTFEDGSTQKWLTAADFDENGNCTYYLMQGAGLQTSTCHSTTVYQGESQETAVKIESL